MPSGECAEGGGKEGEKEKKNTQQSFTFSHDYVNRVPEGKAPGFRI